MSSPFSAPPPVLWEDKTVFRRALLRVVLWVVILVAAALALLNFRAHGWNTIAIVEVLMVFYCAMFLYRLPDTPYLRGWSASLLIIISATVIDSILTRSMLNDGFYWLLVIPSSSLLLLGLFWGGVLAGLVGLVGVVALLWVQPPHGGNMTVAVGINAALTYLSIWAISHVYERKRNQMMEQLRQIASQDPLTGLHNRLHLEDVFAQLCQQHGRSPFTLILIDIDHFKSVNDNFGHESGDEVLRYFAKLLSRHTREQDWLFRVGGEEFCLILPHCDAEGAMLVAEKLRSTVAESPLLLNGQTIDFTVSIGLAQWRKDGKDFDSLYRQADMRLYQAKNTGRNTVVSH
ncbi:GGDEF domain-containing protein [Gallaecimonas mangrovi]|uniref:GGDEF domain-containing protein n=1 Tax=Gallaecimonas mangrovi TaxID=2291597 RepID=UPI001868FD48|nr:GGDEF domain-containing protein [Gallaecimonas mangrovi]